MKYICFKLRDGTEELIMFPESIDHDVFASGMEFLRNQLYGQWELVGRTPVSAGFISCDMVCSGRSETLNLNSREEIDTNMLREQLGG